MAEAFARQVLDVGCGAGNYTLKLLERLPNLDVTLIDLSLPMLERAVRLSRGARGNRAALVRAYRAAGKMGEARRGAEELVALDASYAPGHLELGRTLEAQGDALGAAGAYESYLLLAPNYGDSEEIRVKTQRLRTTGSGAVPTLRKK